MEKSKFLLFWIAKHQHLREIEEFSLFWIAKSQVFGKLGWGSK